MADAWELSGNPSSVHSEGRKARRLVEDARAAIAAAAGAHAVVPFLVARGVSLTAKNDKGETALALAESQERIRYQRDRRDAKLQRSFDNPNIRDPDSIVLESETSDAIERLMHMETAPLRSAKVSINPRS